MVKWNEAEVLSSLSFKTADWEGRLSYKCPKTSGGFNLQQQTYKERYCRLYGNLLVLEKVDKGDCAAVLVMEHYTVQAEDPDIFLFCIIFQIQEGAEEKHCFVAENLRSMNQWISALAESSYEKKREQLINLQIKLRSTTGIDPLGKLGGTNLEWNPLYTLPQEESVQYITPRSARKCIHRKAPPIPGSNGSAPKSNFTSHLGITAWEEEGKGREEEKKDCDNCDKSVGQVTPSFKSHLPDMDTNLIQF